MREIYSFLLFFTFFKHLVCNIYKPVFFEEEEVRHVRDVNNQKPPCKDDTLMEYLAECQVTNPESIVGIAIKDFDSACKTVPAKTRKIDKLLKNCSATGLYFYLINGLKSFDEKLCKNNIFYRRYDFYDKCITDLNKDYDSCDGVADWNEDEDKEKICRTYNRILDCYYIKTAKVCGLRAALTLKELMVEVIDCSIKIKCNVAANPYVKDPMNEKYVDLLNKGESNPENNKSLQNMLLNFLVTAFIYLLQY